MGEDLLEANALVLSAIRTRIDGEVELGEPVETYVYGRTAVAVDWSTIEVPEVVARKRGVDELNAFALREVGRRLVVLGACTGSDAHAVGIDAIMNMKGYAGDYGLERYPTFESHNLGAQVPNDELVAKEDGVYAKLLRMQTEMQSIIAIA